MNIEPESVRSANQVLDKLSLQWYEFLNEGYPMTMINDIESVMDGVEWTLYGKIYHMPPDI